MKEKDECIWNKFLSGDMEAYTQIYHKYIRLLFSYGLQFISDKEQIKDCIQDVFEKIHRNRKELRPIDNVKDYLLIAMRNNLMNILKKENSHLKYISLTECSQIDVETSAEEKWATVEEEEEIKYKVNQVMKMLSPRQREAIYLRYIQELSINEIALVMDANYQSVQNLIQRSFKKIREDLIKNN